jgi:hypothetical protein
MLCCFLFLEDAHQVLATRGVMMMSLGATIGMLLLMVRLGVLAMPMLAMPMLLMVRLEVLRGLSNRINLLAVLAQR